MTLFCRDQNKLFIWFGLSVYNYKDDVLKMAGICFYCHCCNCTKVKTFDLERICDDSNHNRFDLKHITDSFANLLLQQLSDKWWTSIFDGEILMKTGTFKISQSHDNLHTLDNYHQINVQVCFSSIQVVEAWWASIPTHMRPLYHNQTHTHHINILK